MMISIHSRTPASSIS